MGRRYFYRPGHPKASHNGFVLQEDLGWEPPKEAKFSPIMMDRHYENMAATDGTDIGSRRKHQEYMKRNNLTVSADFSPAYYENIRKAEQKANDKDRREAVGRALYEVMDRRK
jgi:hypothetical protein